MARTAGASQAIQPLRVPGRLRLSRWTPWADRNDITRSDAPGVYLLGRFRGPPPARVTALDEHVVYIGETVQRKLRQRWRQFNRSAFEGTFGHSGGATYRACVAKTPRHLYVAALPVTIAEPAASSYIRAVERLLIWAHVERYDRFPICNRK